MVLSPPDRAVCSCTSAFFIRSVRNLSPIVLQCLAEMQAMGIALGLVCRCLANLLLVLVGEFSPLSLVVFHRSPGASMPASVINIQSIAKKESVVEIGFVVPAPASHAFGSPRGLLYLPYGGNHYWLTYDALRKRAEGGGNRCWKRGRKTALRTPLLAFFPMGFRGEIRLVRRGGFPVRFWGC